MNGMAMVSNVLATVSRWAKLIPGLLRHDPLFRYAAIAAGLALFFLAARVAQEFAGPGAIPPSGTNRTEQNIAPSDGQSKADEEPPAPGASTARPAPGDATPLAITPSRSLDGLEVEPAPRDRFGIFPQRETAQ